ncbi:hypothetical protein GTA08_BOTSDO06675 [Neofusicoccum parvum]|nr:hypothetical protein GTA08_BOTSDO06675 [Neofusicoccum parvum]
MEAAVSSDQCTRDPYTWHRLIIDWADEAYNSSVWRLLNIVSAVETTIKDRLQNEINLAFNLVAQRDGQLARIDNITMKTIAAVTLAFLPGTFIASLFGMNFFDFSADGDGQTWAVSEKLWLYWAVTLPLTFLTLGSWWAWDFRQKQWKFYEHPRAKKEAIEKPKQKREPEVGYV